MILRRKELETSVLMEIERVLNTILIYEAGMCSLVGVVINRELVTSRFPEASNYIKIIMNAPHMKGILDAYRFIIYFMSTIILISLAYFISIEVFKLRFALAGVMGLVELLFVSRFIRKTSAYLSFINRMLEEEHKGEDDNGRL